MSRSIASAPAPASQPDTGPDVGGGSATGILPPVDAASRRKGKAPTLKDSDWEPMKVRISQLYGDLTIAQLRETIGREFHFQATERQFLSRIQKWRLDKNNKRKETMFMVQKQRHRRINQPEKPDYIFRIRGKVVPPEKIERGEARMLTMNSAVSPGSTQATPTDMSYSPRTPATYTSTPRISSAPIESDQDISMALASPAAETPRLLVSAEFEGQSPAPWNDEIEDLLSTVMKDTASVEERSPPQPTSVRHRYMEEEEISLRTEIQKMERMYGRDSLQVLGLSQCLLRVLRDQCRYNAAEEIGGSCLFIYRKFYPDTDGLAVAMADLADLALRQGNLSKAEKLANKACALRAFNIGEDDTTISCKVVLLGVYNHDGRWQEVEKVAEFLLNFQSMTLSNMHYASVTGNLAHTLEVKGRLKEAYAWTTQSLNSSLQIFGRGSHAHITARIALAQQAQLLARWDEAKRMTLENLSLCKERCGLEHLLTACVYQGFGLLYRDQGQWQEADVFFQIANTVFRKIVGPTHRLVFDTLLSRLRLHSEWQMWDEAADLITQYRALAPTLSSAQRAFLSMRQAEILDAHGKHEDARNVGHNAARALESNLPLEGPDALNVMTTILRNLRDMRASEDFGSRAVRQSERVYGPRHPYTSKYKDNLARTWMAKGEFGKAVQTMQECVDALRSVAGPDHYLTVRSRDTLEAWIGSQTAGGWLNGWV